MSRNGESRDLCRSRSIVRVVTSRRLLWAGQVTGIGETRNCRAETAWKKKEAEMFDLRNVVCGDMNWIDLYQDRVQHVMDPHGLLLKN
jgi:hypothetical protein